MARFKATTPSSLLVTTNNLQKLQNFQIAEEVYSQDSLLEPNVDIHMKIRLKYIIYSQMVKSLLKCVPRIACLNLKWT